MKTMSSQICFFIVYFIDNQTNPIKNNLLLSETREIPVFDNSESEISLNGLGFSCFDNRFDLQMNL